MKISGEDPWCSMFPSCMSWGVLVPALMPHSKAINSSPGLALEYLHSQTTQCKHLASELGNSVSQIVIPGLSFSLGISLLPHTPPPSSSILLKCSLCKSLHFLLVMVHLPTSAPSTHKSCHRFPFVILFSTENIYKVFMAGQRLKTSFAPGGFLEKKELFWSILIFDVCCHHSSLGLN